MKPPKWALDLTRDVVIYLIDQGVQVSLPLVKWRHCFRVTSSGTCYPHYISISAGLSRIDAKLVLLHELSHWGLPEYKNKYWVFHFDWDIKNHEGHTPRFWALAWQLYRHYKLPIRYCKQREGEYRKGALIAYRLTKGF